MKQLSISQKKAVTIVLVILGFLSFIPFLFNAIKTRQISVIVLICYLILPAYIVITTELLFKKKTLLGLSLAFCATTILNGFIFEIDPGAITFIRCVIAPWFYSLVIASLWQLWHHFKGEAGWQAGLSLILILSSIITTRSIISIIRPLDLYFLWRFEGYNEVVNLIQTEKIRPLRNDETGLIDLPIKYHYLSEAWSVQAYQNNGVWRIFFFKSRDAQGLTGYLYLSNNAPPDSNDWCNNWQRLDYPNWFYCDFQFGR
ncbi:MAG: hypothetical protein J0L96_15825 [Anaerolineae bacterium]|nr:hypothetical protein [Anaerolineae bacterium]